MPRYTVKCENCGAEHEVSRYKVLDIVKDCKYCYDDLCPHCEQEYAMHKDCYELWKEEGAREDEANN